MLALEAQGCDAEDAVAALANLISPQSHSSEDQHRDGACWSAKTRPTQGASTEGSSTESPVPQRSDRSVKCGPRWDSWKRGSGTGARHLIVVLQPEGGGFVEEASVKVDRPRDLALDYCEEPHDETPVCVNLMMSEPFQNKPEHPEATNLSSENRSVLLTFCRG